ncbi:ArsR/SmtB family transcription factor [Nonlabens ponticola]|uniref:ArsR family transcriptional regulator n=1 Tax=Nonlabens ponticola TaxID=2496866 RepID=A0A3S9MVD5_9FLAO|nr:metalloregulator ArsR/SmtB family transcription factor [Nonlabens ponticola]AZQ43161.1 ArsR family transcriptional regulator [Nonlabens ponticola]
MGATKISNYSSEQLVVSAFAKALSHPARIAIIQHLVSRETCVCGDLVLEIGLAQATISQHLKALKETGLIQGTITGTSTCYCINQAVWSQLQDTLGTFLNTPAKEKINCC